MSRKDETADSRIPVKPSTFELAKEQKDDGETWDKFLRDRVTGDRGGRRR